MKTVLFFAYLLGVFILFFLLFSCIGVMWGYEYKQVISDKGWFMVYSLFLGSWITIFCGREYYVKNNLDIF